MSKAIRREDRYFKVPGTTSRRAIARAGVSSTAVSGCAWGWLNNDQSLVVKRRFCLLRAGTAKFGQSSPSCSHFADAGGIWRRRETTALYPSESWQRAPPAVQSRAGQELPLSAVQRWRRGGYGSLVGLTDSQRILWTVATFSSVIFVAQTILTFVGMGGEGGETAGADADASDGGDP